MFMKTIPSHRRSGRQPIAQARPFSHLRAVSHTRADSPGRAGARSGGNGHTSASRTVPAGRSEVTAWLAKPKHNLIGGKWVPAVSGKTFEVFNPADAAVIARVPDSDREDINRAV